MDDQHSDNDLSLSFQSSSFESIPDIVSGRAHNIQPYQFEAEIADESDNELDASDVLAVDWDERMRNTNWCQCGHCQVMPKAEECICCQEIARVQDKMDELATPTQCITEHPGFTSHTIFPIDL